MRPLLAILVLLAPLVLAPELSAQERNPFLLEPGDRIRLNGPLPDDDRSLARVVTVGPVYFGFSMEGPDDRVFLRAYETIDTLDVRQRSRRYSARSGALWGVYIGAAAGMIAGPLSARSLDIETDSAIGIFGSTGGVVGALTGALAGALIAPGRWYRYVVR